MVVVMPTGAPYRATVVGNAWADEVSPPDHMVHVRPDAAFGPDGWQRTIVPDRWLQPIPVVDRLAELYP